MSSLVKSVQIENIELFFNPQNIEVNTEGNEQYLDIKLYSGTNNVSTSKKTIALVIDKSGSMDGEKLDQVKRSSNFVISNLNKGDKLLVITYDSNVNVLIPMSEIKTNDKFEKMQYFNQINKISPGTCTNLSGGLYKALELMSDYNDSSIKSIFLLTDGVINEGDTDFSVINDNIKFLNDPSKNNNISIHSFGLGSDHEPDTLEQISDSFFFIENPDKSAEAFADRLGSIIGTVAQDIYINLLFDDKIKCDFCSKDDYLYTKLSDNEINVKLKSLEIGSKKNLIFKTNFLPVNEEGIYKYVKISVKYKNMIITNPTFVSTVNEYMITRKKSPEVIPNIKLDEQINRLKLVEYFKTVQNYFKNNQIDDGISILNALKEELQNSISKETEFTLQLIKIINDHIKSIKEKNRQENEALFVQSISSQTRQRSAGNNNMYVTPIQQNMIEASQAMDLDDFGDNYNGNNSNSSDFINLTQKQYPQ